MAAGDKCIQAFEAMHTPHLYQPLQRSVDLQRCIEPRVLQLLKDAIRGQWLLGVLQHSHDQMLVSRQFRFLQVH